jgi:sigma-B regulation protein RsbU (phosphoserine phosphatase)
MSGTEQQLSLSRKWPVAFWLGAVFCFFLFPVFLVDVGLDSLLETRRNVQKQEIFRQLNRNLEQLMQFKNSRHYYHALLKKVFDLAHQQKNPIAYLQKALPHLKARNPATFRFIVWDDKGRVIDSLTDEKGYRYIVKTIFDVFSDVSSDCQTNYPGTPDTLASVDKRLNLLRSYLGAFLIPEKLNLPMFRGSLGEIIMAASEPEKSHFWYQIGKKFSIMATVSIDAVQSSDYLKKLITGMNRNNDRQIKCGIAELVKARGIFTAIAPQHPQELLVEIGKFRNFSESHLETANYLVSVRMINSFIIAFSFVSKHGNLIEAGFLRRVILSVFALVIAVISAAFIYAVYLRNHILSIRFKLAFLFIYANGLPLIILGFLGYEYLQQTRRLLLDQVQEQVASLVNDFDSRYETIKTGYARQLNELFDEVDNNVKTRSANAGDLQKVRKHIIGTRPYDFIVADRDGKFMLMQVTGQKASNFFSNMSRNLVNYINYKDYTPQHLFREDSDSVGGQGKIKAERLLSGKTIVFHRFLHRARRINPEQMGSEGRQYYWNMLGNVADRDFHNLIIISWKHEVLQENYLRQNFAGLDANFGQFRFFAMIESNGTTYPLQQKPDREILNLFRQTFSFKVTTADAIEIDGRRYAAYSALGRHLDRVAIAGLIPLDQIDARVDELKRRLIMFALLSLSLTLGIGSLLSFQFMQPVKELEKGVQAIGRQDFRYRLPVKTCDEFGQLGNVFNSAIESLEDLEIAKVVQENLFPHENLRQNHLEIFGRSVAMTRLGGDYYDFFSINNNNVGVLMGDVAGHGIPAAMLMAMAKASVLLTDEEKSDPAMMLSSLHKVIYRVKSSKIKRMMTCQYFCIDAESGACRVANAGHCFPAVIRKRGEEVELIKLIGTPLGITKKPKYENTGMQLLNGDIVLLYTDGIIESQNTSGKEMGFDNFSRILASSYDDNLEVYYDNVFNAYKQWSAKADDDITMVLIRFAQTKEGTPT